jgi:DNA-binding IclR family transcriptional regulator
MTVWDPASSSRTAPTAERALRILESLAVDPARSYTLAELQRRLGYSHGNLHAILATLVAMGHVRRDSTDRSYSLGPALLAIGAAARQAYPSVDAATPHMDALAAELDTECQAGMRVGDSIVIVARVGPLLPFGFGVQVGERFPLTPPIGSSFFAWAAPDDLELYLKSAVAALGPTAIDRHREAIAAVRRRGYSVHVDAAPRARLSETAARILQEASRDDHDDELASLAHELGRHDYVPIKPDKVEAGDVIQLSAPVFGPDENVELTIGVTFVAPWREKHPLTEVPERLLQTTRVVTRAIGGRAPVTALAPPAQP